MSTRLSPGETGPVQQHSHPSGVLHELFDNAFFILCSVLTYLLGWLGWRPALHRLFRQEASIRRELEAIRPSADWEFLSARMDYQKRKALEKNLSEEELHALIAAENDQLLTDRLAEGLFARYGCNPRRKLQGEERRLQ